MGLLFSVIVLKLVFVSGQSPCPGVFDYQNNGGEIYGVITLQPSEPTSTLVLRVSFTVTARLPSSYVGKLQPVDVQRGLLRYNQGAPLVYRVLFPVTSPLPRLYELVVNDRTLCSGTKDVLGPNQYLSTFSLQHTLFIQRRVNSVYSVNRPNFVKPNSGSSSQENHPIFTISNDKLESDFPSFVVDRTGDINFNVQQTTQTTESQSFNPFGTGFNQFINRQTPVDYQPDYDRYTTQQPRQPPPDYDRYTTQRPPQHAPEYDFYTTQRPPQPAPEYDFYRPQPPPDYNPYTTQRPPQPPPDYNPYTTERPRPPPRPSNPPRQSSGSDLPGMECGIVGNGAEALIYKGEDYERGDWPWLVAIFKRGRGGTLSFSCGGTLISSKHIVTAAHCVQYKASSTISKDFVVKMGVHDLDDWSDDEVTTRSLESVRPHEMFNSTTLSNDIAVFTLSKSVIYSHIVRPACLWEGNPDQNRIVGTSGVVIGWGKTEYTSVAGRGPPKKAMIPIVRTSTCRASKPAFHRITSENTLCAGSNADGSNACKGDSGGGLYLLDNGRWRLRGIVSLSLLPENGYTGDDTCRVDQYVVFTDAAKYDTWIKEIVRSSFI